MEMPVCLLGPGGDYVYPWPDESSPESVDFATEPLLSAEDTDAHPEDPAVAPASRSGGSRRSSSPRSRRRR